MAVAVGLAGARVPPRFKSLAALFGFAWMTLDPPTVFREPLGAARPAAAPLAAPVAVAPPAAVPPEAAPPAAVCASTKIVPVKRPSDAIAALR